MSRQDRLNERRDGSTTSAIISPLGSNLYNTRGEIGPEFGRKFQLLRPQTSQLPPQLAPPPARFSIFQLCSSTTQQPHSGHTAATHRRPIAGVELQAATEAEAEAEAEPEPETVIVWAPFGPPNFAPLARRE